MCVKVKNTAALDLKKLDSYVDYICHVDCIYIGFMWGESIISRIISDLNFPPLCQN